MQKSTNYNIGDKVWYLWNKKFCSGLITEVFDGVVIIGKIGISKSQLFDSYESLKAWAEANGK